MTEWTDLAVLWQAAADRAGAAPLRKIVASHRRRLLLVAVVEIAIVLAVACLSAFAGRDELALWEIVWLITLWGFTIVASAFAWWNRRGTWHALGESVEEYVRLTRLRAARQMRSIDFACGLFVAEVGAIVSQLLWFDRFTLLTSALLATSGAVMAGWCWAAKRKVARDLALVEEYGREL